MKVHQADCSCGICRRARERRAMRRRLLTMEERMAEILRQQDERPRLAPASAEDFPHD